MENGGRASLSAANILGLYANSLTHNRSADNSILSTEFSLLERWFYHGFMRQRPAPRAA